MEDILERKVAELYGSIIKQRTPIRNPHLALEVLEKEYKLVVDERIVTLTFAAFYNGRPVLFEGPPGTGKTEIGYALLELWSGKQPFILPCSENYDEYRVIGDFHPLMAMKLGFNEESFTPRPLLSALLLDTGILIDEVRRSSEEFQNMVLDIIDKRRIIIPELKRYYKANELGFQVIFTSNPEDIGQNELSDAFLRRVIRLEFDYPPSNIEERIMELRALSKPILGGDVLSFMSEVIEMLRKSPALYKPGTSDLVEWGRLSQIIAQLYEREKVTIEDAIEAAYAVLLKRLEDNELVEKTLRDAGSHIDL
ncbi:MAG: MoxR family ATPase [Desulfurococcales archaeon]|nr:MoxR family ATPase [Desulfurococcales archaeon]